MPRIESIARRSPTRSSSVRCSLRSVGRLASRAFRVATAVNPFLDGAIRDPPARPDGAGRPRGIAAASLAVFGRRLPSGGGTHGAVVAGARCAGGCAAPGSGPPSRSGRSPTACCSRPLPPYEGVPPGIVGCLLLAGFANLFLIAVRGAARGPRAAPPAPGPAAADRRRLRGRVADRRPLCAPARAAACCTGPRWPRTATTTARWSAAAADYVAASAPRWAPGLAALDVRELARDVYRACVPGTDPRRWLCLIVDTDTRPRASRATTRCSRTSGDALEREAGSGFSSRSRMRPRNCAASAP